MIDHGCGEGYFEGHALASATASPPPFSPDGIVVRRFHGRPATRAVATRGPPFADGSEFGCAAVSTTAVTRVPCPGAVSIVTFPPIADTRSVMLVNPVPRVAGSNPRPVSLIVRVSVGPSA